jgi:hypothetical protein
MKPLQNSITSGVTSITDYCSGVWGFDNCDKAELIQNRAIRFYLGVHRFAAVAAIQGDMGWLTSKGRFMVNALRLWNRLLNMHDDRLAKRVFLWEHDLDLNNWTSDIGKICEKLCLDDSYNNMLPVSLQAAKAQALKYQEEMWKITVNGKPKLRKYKDLKLNMPPERYGKFILNRKESSSCPASLWHSPSANRNWWF